VVVSEDNNEKKKILPSDLLALCFQRRWSLFVLISVSLRASSDAFSVSRIILKQFIKLKEALRYDFNGLICFQTREKKKTQLYY